MIKLMIEEKIKLYLFPAIFLIIFIILCVPVLFSAFSKSNSDPIGSQILSSLYIFLIIGLLQILFLINIGIKKIESDNVNNINSEMNIKTLSTTIIGTIVYMISLYFIVGFSTIIESSTIISIGMVQWIVIIGIIYLISNLISANIIAWKLKKYLNYNQPNNLEK